MSAPLLAIAWRESRTARRRLLLYMSSISFGVAALVAIDSFSRNVTASVHDQSRALMGGDLSVTSREKFSRAADSILTAETEHKNIQVARQTTFPSMVVYSPFLSTRLIEARAVTPNFPLYGAITTLPVSAWNELHTGRNVVVDRGLLVTLGANVGDSLSLGTARFKIVGVLESVPGDLGIAATIGPRVYFDARNVEATGLLGFGSRASYEAVIKLPPALTPDAFTKDVARPLQVAGINQVRSAGRNEQRLSETIDQLADFLALVGLVALLLGGIGVASGVHAFVMRKIDTVAVLRCVGATSWQVLAIYVSQAAAMGFVGASIGAAAGVGMQLSLPRLIKEFLPLNVEIALVPSVVAVGLVIGLWVALIFALRPLVAVRGISPLQALRRDTDAEVLKQARFDSMHIVVNIAIVASLLVLGLARAQTVGRGLAYSAAIGIAITTLWAVAAGLVIGARHLVRPGLPFPVRQGIAALYRPGNQTRAVILALGFGVFLIGTLYQVQRNLLRSLDTRLDQSKANVVFFDVQEAMLAGVDSMIRGAGHQVLETTPIIRMRIASINGRAMRQRPSDTTRGSSADSTRGRRGGWAGGREYNSTYRDTLTSAERLTAGKWFATTHAPGTLPEISVERSVANTLGLKMSDTVTWDVQGVEVPTRVTSFREVQWANFQTNFFVVFSPDALIKAPKQFVLLADARDPASIARLQGAVVSRYPTISSIDLTLVRKTIVDVIGKVTTAIRFLALLSLGLAVPVLFSAVSATRRQRLREGVLLKTLGATRRQIGQIMVSEYALLGGLGALGGVILSTLGAWALMHWIFKSAFIPVLLPMVAVAAGMMALSVSIGLLTGREVFSETPMAALRDA